MESASPRKSLPQSWSGMLSDLVHQKTKRSVWKLFWKLDSLGSNGVGFTQKITSSFLTCDAKTWSTKKQREVCENCFGNWTVLLCWTDLELFTIEGWLIAISNGVSFTQKISSSVLIWDATRLGPPKNKEKSVKTVSETGLSCCTKQILNCVQEMGDQ